MPQYQWDVFDLPIRLSEKDPVFVQWNQVFASYPLEIGVRRWGARLVNEKARRLAPPDRKGIFLPMRLTPARQKELLRDLAETLPKLRHGESLAYYRRLARRFGVTVDAIRYYVGRASGLPPVQAGNPDLLDTVPMPHLPKSAARGEEARPSETSRILRPHP